MTLAHPTDTLDIQALFPEGTQLIGGEWVPARDRDTIPVINPATGAESILDYTQVKSVIIDGRA